MNNTSLSSSGSLKTVTQVSICDREIGGICYWTQMLNRLGQLNSIFEGKGPEVRKSVIEKVMGIVEKNMREMSKSYSPEVGEDMLGELAKVDLRIIMPYDDMDMDGLQSRPDKFMFTLYKDLYSVKTTPFCISSLGLNGPTLLINYSRRNFEDSSLWVQNAVIKWTSKLEFDSTRLFHLFFTAIQDKTLRVPRATFLNLDTKERLCMDGRKEIITFEDSERLVKDVLKIAEHNNCFPRVCNQLMISEKIVGSNLRDFILARYESLTESQKKSLFRGIGKVAFFDVVLANLDRIHQADRNFDGFAVGMKAPSNLGNMMIKISSDSSKPPILYAIDNNLHIEDRCLYVGFLRKFLSGKYRFDVLARNVINSIAASFKLPTSLFYYDLEEHNLDEDEPAAVEDEPAAVNIRSFLADMESFGKKELSAGAAEMEQKMKKVALSLHMPFEGELFDIIQERIQTLMQGGI